MSAVLGDDIMEKLNVFEGLIVPLDRANIDTDQIIPRQIRTAIDRTGFGQNLFDEWRYLDRGEPGMDHSKRPLNPDFILNKSRDRGARSCSRRQNSAAVPP